MFVLLLLDFLKKFYRHHLLTSHYGRYRLSYSDSFLSLVPPNTCTLSSSHPANIIIILLQSKFRDFMAMYAIQDFIVNFDYSSFSEQSFVFPGVNCLLFVCIYVGYSMYLSPIQSQLSKGCPHFFPVASESLWIPPHEGVFPWPLNCWWTVALPARCMAVVLRPPFSVNVGISFTSLSP